jgi:hypothetical protein
MHERYRVGTCSNWTPDCLACGRLIIFSMSLTCMNTPSRGGVQTRGCRVGYTLHVDVALGISVSGRTLVVDIVNLLIRS